MIYISSFHPPTQVTDDLVMVLQPQLHCLQAGTQEQAFPPEGSLLRVHHSGGWLWGRLLGPWSPNLISLEPVSRMEGKAVIPGQEQPLVTNLGEDGRLRGPSLRVRYHGFNFASALESYYAHLFARLGIKYTYESIVQRAPVEGRLRYTPDFVISLPHGPGVPVSRRVAHVLEIKPQYPNQEQMDLCRLFSDALPGIMVVLFYGNMQAGPGFKASSREAHHSDWYSHSRGIRGMAWRSGQRLAGDWALTFDAETQVVDCEAVLDAESNRRAVALRQLMTGSSSTVSSKFRGAQ